MGKIRKRRKERPATQTVPIQYSYSAIIHGTETDSFKNIPLLCKHLMELGYLEETDLIGKTFKDIQLFLQHKNIQIINHSFTNI